MVHKFQEQKDYDDYDPVPYQGGYDQAAAYGSLKPADKECGYPRSQYAVGVDEPEAQYGNERNPYERGPPGPSIFGGSPKPGAVYGGGRDRTRPSNDEAQPDRGAKTGYGGQEDSSNSKPSHSQEETPTYEVSEEAEYRKLRSIHNQEAPPDPNSTPPDGEEEQSVYHAQPYSFNAEVSGYRQPYYTYGEAGSGYYKPQPPYNDEDSSGHRTPQPTYNEVDQYGHRNPFYGYGEAESEYRQPRPTSNDEDSAYHTPYNYVEEGDLGTRNPIQTFREHETAYGRSTSYSDQGNYGGHGHGYGYGYGSGYGPNYGEEAFAGSGYGGGYGGHWNNHADDDPARFGGGSVYTMEPIQETSAPSANRSWW